MDITISFLICVALILAVSVIGAYLPMATKASDRQMHLMIAFSAGVFLGILFLILVPEAMHESEHGGFDDMYVMYLILAGFLIMFVVDFLFKHCRKSGCGCEGCQDHHSHEITSLCAFVGLSVHACFDGLAIATAFLVGEAVGFMVLVAMCLHKVVEVLSLSSTFLLTGDRRKSRAYLAAFCLITPVAALVSYFLLGEVETDIAGLAFAFSAGVFMFVTMLHMIPEAFHRKDIDIKSLVLLILGLATVICITLMMGPHSHAL
ncbi:MAG: ZIP family metal transporter [Candidatus Methanoplasma sp.]|jgi:zinc transporter ZupT|nr:ZIP family metal transporter [Candidatus Methanoplasma sp.]